MKLIRELIEYCIRNGLVTLSQIAQLRERGLLSEEADFSRIIGLFTSLPEQFGELIHEHEQELQKVWEQGLLDRELSQEDPTLLIEQMAQRRTSRKKSAGAMGVRRKELTGAKLDAMLGEKLEDFFRNPFLIRLEKQLQIVEKNPREAVTKLCAFSADELHKALHELQLYEDEILDALPDLSFLDEFGGSAVKACKLMCQRYDSPAIASKYAWILKHENVKLLYRILHGF